MLLRGRARAGLDLGPEPSADCEDKGAPARSLPGPAGGHARPRVLQTALPSHPRVSLGGSRDSDRVEASLAGHALRGSKEKNSGKLASARCSANGERVAFTMSFCFLYFRML